MIHRRHVIIGAPWMRIMTPRSAAAGNGLLNALIAYWPGNEASGNALDLHTNGLTLTDTNTVTNAAGLVYATARQYTAANTEYHTRGDNALLSTGDVDFTIAAWAYLDSKVVSRTIIAKMGGAGAREYWLGYDATADQFRLWVSPNGTTSNNLYATTFGSPSLSTWYLVVAWHDSVANTLNIQAQNGTVDSVAHTTGVIDGPNAFQVGIYSSSLSPWNGRIGPSMFWKSAAGAGGVLTAAQRTALYNAGAGLPYASFTV